jgi:hypothetical protein
MPCLAANGRRSVALDTCDLVGSKDVKAIISLRLAMASNAALFFISQACLSVPAAHT